MKSDNTVINTDNISDCESETCKLYKCITADGATSCTESTITGYAKFALNGSWLSCSNGSCTSYTVISSCNSVGALFGSIPKLCNVSGGSGVSLSSSTATYYYLNTVGTGTPFTASNNILVKVENNMVSIVTTESMYITYI